ncbi:hypothetical protein BDZ89DRAFT_1158462 [Hymenopellis radicata]|nr:hypothetical protein BDZ89DRAFT_1158462 [Hymenopellis radicata]
MLRQPRLSQYARQEAVGEQEPKSASDLILNGGILPTKPEALRDPLPTPAPVASSALPLDNPDKSLLFSGLLSIVSSMRQDTRMTPFLPSTGQDTMASTALSPSEMDFSQVETTSMDPASTFSDVLTATSGEMTATSEEMTGASAETTTTTAAESDTQSLILSTNTPSGTRSQMHEILAPTTMDTIASSFSSLSTSLQTSQVDVAPTLIRSAPPASVNLPSATTSAIPISPEGADAVHHDPPFHKYIVMAVILLSFFLIFLGIYAVTNFKRFVAWIRRKNAPKPVQWDYGVWTKLNDEETVKVPTDSNVQDLRSRFSDATSASAYSFVTSARSSTMSDYYVDPRYSGPTVLPPILPPALRDAEVAQSLPSATPHTLTPRTLHPSTPHRCAWRIAAPFSGRVLFASFNELCTC